MVLPSARFTQGAFANPGTVSVRQSQDKLKPLPHPLYVAQPAMPPRRALDARLDEVYASGWLTNNGPQVRELEVRLGRRLRVPQVAYVSNGTVALQLALQALDVRGSVITTPFSYVATANAIALAGCAPVFADVDADTLCLDPDALAAALRPDTAAVVAVPVYGRPCRHEALAAFAKTHGLRLIYDAAHAFGTELNGHSLAGLGDAASLSFHATKAFHSVEGGGVVLADAGARERVGYLRSHGHADDEYAMVGTNAKNSELHAAVGLCNLEGFDEAVVRRCRVYETYRRAFGGSAVRMFDPGSVAGLRYNYAYAPVRFPDEESLLAAKAHLESLNVFPRRYFHPSLASLPQFGAQDACPRAAEAARTSLCLPLSPQLPLATARAIAMATLSAIEAGVATAATQVPGSRPARVPTEGRPNVLT